MHSSQYVLILYILYSSIFAPCNAFVICRQQPQSQTSLWVSTTIPEASSVISDNTDDDDARSEFGTKTYWDELYQGRGDFPADEYSWYFGWEGYGQFVKEYVPSKDSQILVPGIGNDGILLDLLKNGYEKLTATDYSEHAIERQIDLVSYEYSDEDAGVELLPMDARQMKEDWTDRFDAVLEKGAFDAIYLSGDGNLEQSVKEVERVLKPGGILLSVSGVVPEELRKEVFRDWEWVRDGSDELKAGCFVLKRPEVV